MPKKAGTSLTAEEIDAYRRARERINKQLYRLEKAEQAGKGEFTKFAYQTAMRDIKSLYGKGKRFSKTPPATRKEYEKVMNMIRRFYEKPSSTISGTKRVYENRARQLSKTMGTAVSQGDLKNLFESGLYERLKDKFGYSTGFRILSTLQANRGKMKEMLDRSGRLNFSAAGDDRRRLQEFNKTRAGHRLLTEFIAAEGGDG